MSKYAITLHLPEVNMSTVPDKLLNKTVSPLVATISIVATVAVVVGLGLLIGYSFFWNAYDKENRLDHNLKVAQESVDAGAQNANAHLTLGLAYAEQGKQDLALKEFEAARNLDPKNLTVRYNIALIKIGQKDLTGARQDLESIRAQNPKYIEARATLGSVLLELKEYKLAAQELEVVNSLEPGKSDILFYLAQAYRNSGDVNKAKAALEKAIKYNPSDEQLRKALESLTND